MVVVREYKYMKYLPEEAKKSLAKHGMVAVLEYEDYDGYPDFAYCPIDTILENPNMFRNAISYRILTKNGEELLFGDFEEFMEYLRKHF